MQEGRAAGDDLHRVRDAERVEQGHRVLLGVEDIDGPPPLQYRPSPVALALPRRTAAAAMR